MGLVDRSPALIDCVSFVFVFVFYSEGGDFDDSDSLEKKESASM